MSLKATRRSFLKGVVTTAGIAAASAVACSSKAVSDSGPGYVMPDITAGRKFKCSICGYIYDEFEGSPEQGIAPGTKWGDLPNDFECPVCSSPKAMFIQNEEEASKPEQTSDADSKHIKNIKEFSAGEISAVCSNLANACEKQRLMAEMEAFTKLADYFKSKVAMVQGKTLDDAAAMLNDDISKGFVTANAAAKAHADRGALRSLTWSGKVSLMLKSLLDRFAKEGDAMLENKKIYVCDICGFIILGDTPPEACPVCKVPKFKINEAERR